MIGTVLFPLFYCILFVVVGYFTGFVKAIGISLSLLFAGYLTLWYWEAVKTLSTVSRKIFLWFTNGKMMRALIQERNKVISELNKLLIG